MAVQEVELLFPEFGIAPLHLEVLLGVELPDHGQAQDPEAVAAHVGNLLGDVDIHAVNDGHDRDQRGGGQDDS